MTQYSENEGKYTQGRKHFASGGVCCYIMRATRGTRASGQRDATQTCVTKNLRNGHLCSNRNNFNKTITTLDTRTKDWQNSKLRFCDKSIYMKKY